jgi:cytochrome c2
MRGQGVRRLRLDSENRVVYDEEVRFGHRIRDIAILRNGLVALLTDDRYLIVIDDGDPSFEEPSPFVANRISELEKFDNMSGDGAVREETRTPAMVFNQHCATCHLLNQRSEIGPHLNGLFGREVGAAGDYNYSSAFRNDSRIWDEDLLRSLLTEPDAEFRGNRMNKIELSR